MVNVNKVLYCKETGELTTGELTCLIHGKQDEDHFEEEKNNIKVCEICGKGFYCLDDIRKVCSMSCAGEYAKDKSRKGKH